ncbi:MAG TPA: RNA polymerase sigma factor [Solirubrobacteraceae bacterium]|nr:RNA polymerase sigma factor [Solirubrobacteraceae bacterium]
MEVSALKQANVPGLHGPSPLLRLQSDERLIALIRRGQHAAFETLVSRYQSRLLAFCRHMLGSREDAEDVLQEVFAAAFNAILADERAINVRPWLYRIARNRSLNHLRRASAIGVDSMDVHFADHGQSTSEKVLHKERFRQLVADVQQLPETQRTALLLREIDALSYEQIAHAMETTVPSVKSLLVRARISLAEAAEARKLSCTEVRLELGEVAEGLAKMSAPVRRHVRECDRCRAFRKQLKQNNVALAAIFPIGPLLIFKKLALAKLGSTAGAGGAHVAGAGSAAAVGAGAAGSAGGAGASGLVTSIGAGALATKAAAGLAAAALVTAGAVEADHAATHVSHHRHVAVASTHTQIAARPVQPLIIHSAAQPTSSIDHSARADEDAKSDRAKADADKLAKLKQAAEKPATVAAPADPAATAPVAPKTPEQPVTEVTSETTQLPSSSTTTAPTAPTAGQTPPSVTAPVSTTDSTPPPTTPTTTPTPDPVLPTTSTKVPTPPAVVPPTQGGVTTHDVTLPARVGGARDSETGVPAAAPTPSTVSPGPTDGTRETSDAPSAPAPATGSTESG